ncbi:glycosyltransferase [Aliiglaciecola sp. LCG003]|uniref:glycosyltransferase n=1 Tax=Aliiglaciecola sp. LCG003 TaxID=3053655 RepID=UPI002574647F|nr:glycosyltransferase [Aliiglaciecola sp. LCG003]WJG10450.1 glycosyltransferase [Aliiglaciecola sp. LCG003]
MKRLRIVVVSSLFPSSVRKQSGLFVRERMFRATQFADIEVVSPVPWFPGQGLISLFKPNYRPMPAELEIQNGIKVHYPRFFSIPGILRKLDGQMMAGAIYKVLKKLDAENPIDVIDSHFTYPDGLAASQAGQKLGKPVTITLRGTELSHSLDQDKKPLLLQAWQQADHMICVSESLKQLAVGLGADERKFTVVGNGVDTQKFNPLPKLDARKDLNISADAKVMITVGGLVKRKGFHRVIACMPELLQIHPNLVYLIVGGASAEGNIEQELRQQASALGLSDRVKFLGSLPPEQLSVPLSAADVFVLSTANEGWANVILESMACGTPVVATDVGGNKEVIANPQVGTIVPFDDHEKLQHAIADALTKEWDEVVIKDYAQANHWDNRMQKLRDIFFTLQQG